MRRLEHCNIVKLKYFFYSSGEKVIQQQRPTPLISNDCVFPCRKMKCFSTWYWNLFQRQFIKWLVIIVNPNRQFLSVLSNSTCTSSFEAWPISIRWASATGISSRRTCSLTRSQECWSFVTLAVPSTSFKESPTSRTFVLVTTERPSSFSEPPITPPT